MANRAGLRKRWSVRWASVGVEKMLLAADGLKRFYGR